LFKSPVTVNPLLTTPLADLILKHHAVTREKYVTFEANKKQILYYFEDAETRDLVKGYYNALNPQLSKREIDANFEKVWKGLESNGWKKALDNGWVYVENGHRVKIE
jgi:hypothetical protein